MSIDDTCTVLTKNLLITYCIYNYVKHVLPQTVFCDVHTFQLTGSMQNRQQLFLELQHLCDYKFV
jgi:hypothetical protein